MHASQRVRDVMLGRPKTLPAGATMADLRRTFANPHVLSALLVDGPSFVGVIDRGEFDDVPDDAPVLPLAHTAGVTIDPDATVSEAMARLDRDGTFRLVVVGPDGAKLEGLLCLDSTRTGFCGGGCD